ncbi:MAG: hypothetical protein U0N53_07985 [Ruthenibacterium sp.]|nr:hypothetical protein [Ruthenibacterium sp.]
MKLINLKQIKVFLKRRIIFTEIVGRMQNYFSPLGRKVMRFITLISKVDSIQDYETFANLTKQMKNEKRVQQERGYGPEARLYGYYREMECYARRKPYLFPLIPGLSHGVSFIAQINRWSLDNSISFGYMGPNMYTLTRKETEVPIFVLGPYIHYARHYYDEEKRKNLKRELGRVLLVFPNHSCEANETGVRQDERLLECIYSKYAKDFDTVMVCVYWHDIDAEILDEYRARGAKIVSAGFRGDQNFVCRLKTIISLADLVVGDDIGTNIGFCYYMGKEFVLESNHPRFDNPNFIQAFWKFHEAFALSGKNFTEEQRKQQKILYEQYWAGEKYLRTPEEMNAILEAMQEVCVAAHFNMNRTLEAVHSLMETWKNKDDSKSRLKCQLLGEALK